MLGNTSTLALSLGPVLNSEIINKKVQKRGYKQSMQKTLVYSIGAETEGRTLPLLTLSWDVNNEQLKFITPPCMSVNDSESSVSVNFGGTNKFFTNTESTNDEGYLCVCVYS